MHLAQQIEHHIHRGDAADTVTLDYEAVSYTHLTLPTKA